MEGQLSTEGNHPHPEASSTEVEPSTVDTHPPVESAPLDGETNGEEGHPQVMFSPSEGEPSTVDSHPPVESAPINGETHGEEGHPQVVSSPIEVEPSTVVSHPPVESAPINGETYEEEGHPQVVSSPIEGEPSTGDDSTCPVTGLTTREKNAIRASWEIVMTDPKGHGVRLFKAFFMAYPEHQAHFKAFRKVSIDQLEKSPFLRIHAATVISALNQLVTSLDDTEPLLLLLEKIGHSHGKRGLKRKHFEDLSGVITKYLVTALGSELTEFGAASWTKALSVMTTVIEQGFTSENWE